MKKFFIISGVILLIMTLSLTVILLKRRQEDLKITTIKKDYHYVYDQTEENTLEVTLYTNQPKSPYFNKEMISKVYLSDKYQNNHYRMFVKDLVSLDSSLTIKNEDFYTYLLTVNLESLDNEINIRDASIVLEYVDNNVFNISIGWVSLYKVDHFGSKNNELAVCHLKGFGLEEEGIPKLKGILIGLRNNSDKKIIVNDIGMLANDVYFDKAKEVHDPNVSFLDDYDIYKQVDVEEVNIELAPNETKYFILPIKYNIKKNLSRFGMSLKYSKDGLSSIMYFDDFVFFSNNNISEKMLDEMIINKYAKN